MPRPESGLDCLTCARFAREDRLATCSPPSQSGVRVTRSTKVAPDEYGTANMVHIRQSRPGSSPEYQVKIVEMVDVVPPLLKSGRLATCSPPSRSGERVTGSTKVAPDEARKSNTPTWHIELGTNQTVKARLWPCLQGRSLHFFQIAPSLLKSGGGRLKTCSPPSQSGERVTGSTNVAPDEAR